MNRSITRLSHLEDVDYVLIFRNELAFQSLLKEKYESPHITSLSASIYGTSLLNYDRAQHLFGRETNQVISDLLVYEEVDQDRIIKSELDPFFRFDLFSNLRSLKMYLSSNCIYPLNPPIIEGFKAVQKLERISIVLGCRPIGTSLIFEGLQFLPLLKIFKLEIPFLRDKDRKLLKDFLQKQTELVSLSLAFFEPETNKENYDSQNKFLESIWRCLASKPQLKCLHLKSHYWPIESLSNGLEQSSLSNQLEELSIQAFDNTVMAKTSHLERVQGLCQLIRQQKQTLKRLTIELKYVYDGKIVSHLIDAVSELKELRKLDLNISSHWNIYWLRNEGFFRTLFSLEGISESNFVKIDVNKIYRKLGKTMPKLQNLSSLELTFSKLSQTQEVFPESFFKFFNILSTMKYLQSLDINAPLRQVENDIKEKVALALIHFKYIKSISINPSDDDDDDDYDQDQLEEVGVQVRLRNALRCDLMF